MKVNKLIALVIPWFGESLKGGAEQQAWQIATRLAARGHPVEVLTTCCRSFFDDWAENHLPAGVTHEAGLTVRRFPVDGRDRAAFDHLNRELLERSPASFLPGVSPVAHERAAIWTQQNINSSALESYLSQRKNDYQAFIFLPYLYGVILRGLPLVADRAWLQPCLHDEAYAYLPNINTIFRKTCGLLFNSTGELQLAAHLYGPMVFTKGSVVGEGIEFEDLDSYRPEHLPTDLRDQPFLLYLGRRDSTKNTDLLIEAYACFRRRQPNSRLRLVLAGPGHASYAGRAPDLLDLGLVSAPVKAALLHHCLALVQPSTNESFSRVMFEAWHCGKPVAAHRDCLATALAVTEAEGGWTADSLEEWAEFLAWLEQAVPAKLERLGRNGQAYARDQADWEAVIDRYEQLLGLCSSPANSLPQGTRRASVSPSPLRAIHQLLPSIAYGDAISNHARTIRNYLRTRGYRSEIFARYIDPRIQHECHPFQRARIEATAGLLYHHSIGSEVTPTAIAHPSPKCLIYHNITPAEFFESYRPDFAELLHQGRRDMYSLAGDFPLSAGVSAFNARELAEFGFRDPGVLPIAVEPVKWDFPADAELMRQLQDGRTNLLFVGRLAPNKRQEQLIEAFAHYLRLDPDARLILVGYGEPSDPYVWHVHQTRARFGLGQRVIITGQVNDTQLAAYYRTAHLFWSMSEHEGFCVPLIEAMWFDIPVLAYKSSAIPETLDKAGMLFTDKTDLRAVAVTARLLVHDPALRSQVLKAQRHRRDAFLSQAVLPQLDALIDRLERSQTLNGQPVDAPRPRVCFVVQRYGEEVNGGAELLCRQIAERMALYWDVEVLTSCARDYVNRFENDYPAGSIFLNGVGVRRFEIDHLRSADEEFLLLDRKVLARESSAAEEQEWLREIGPHCEGLFHYIADHRDDFELFFFFTYLYATTTLALPMVGNKAVLVPNAHDENPIHARFFDDFFSLPKALVLHTPEEAEFLNQRTRGRGAPATVIGGVGFDSPPTLTDSCFRERFGIDGPYLLYAGRIQPEKGCDLLFDYYLALPESFRRRYPLVLIGKAAMPVPEEPTIRAVGYVDESLKISAMTGATVLIMPSPHESLNMAILESWLCGTPVLVNGGCEVLKNQCRRSHGGLWFENQREFTKLVCYFTDDRNQQIRSQLGRQGQWYVRHNYDWTVIEKRYLDLFETICEPNRSKPTDETGGESRA